MPFHWIVSGAFLLSSASFAFAQDTTPDSEETEPTPDPPSSPGHVPWQLADSRAHAVFTAGWITGLSGLGLDVLGLATGNSALSVTGALGEIVGAPMMAGASLRSVRAMRGLGAQVSPALGYTSWGLWGGSLALSVGAAGAYDYEDYVVLSFAGIGCRIAAYVTAGVQQANVGRARRSLGSSATYRSRRSLVVLPDVRPGFVGLSIGA